MNSLEAQLDYPFGELLPETGAAQPVAPGLFWLRMPLPFALNHINLWLLKDNFSAAHGVDGATADVSAAPGWSVVDCGVATEPTRAAWQRQFENSLDGLPIQRVLATHCHPDHVGLADWLCQRWQAPLWMSAGEYAYARMMSAGLPGVDGSAAVPHFQRHGLVDPALLTSLKERSNYYPSHVPAMPSAYTRLQDGQTVPIGGRGWSVITGFGHAPEHVALYCAELQVLIAGDMVLPRISTNVSVFAIEPEANPLQLYLDSLDKFAGLPADTLVLPSHGKPFRGLHTRIRQLHEHHAARLAEVLQACREWQSAADIVPIMFRRPLDTHQLTFALGEALAHLHKLWADGLIRRNKSMDGIIKFRMM